MTILTSLSVMVSFICQDDSFQNNLRVSVRDCQDQIGLWACLRGPAWLLMGVGRLGLDWVLNCVSVERGSWAARVCTHAPPVWTPMGPHASSSSLTSLRKWTVTYNKLWPTINALPLGWLLSVCFYHNNRNKCRTLAPLPLITQALCYLLSQS